MWIVTSLNDEQTEHYKGLLDQVKTDVSNTITSVKTQDKERMIFADLLEKTDIAKLPVFQGDGSDGFVNFGENVKEAFKRNRVVKDDQLVKLRK